MATTEPTTTLDARFSDATASATPWGDGRQRLEAAAVYWLTTVRADGRPHQTPLIGLWRDDAFVFTTGPSEQKARNLAANPNVLVTTGANAYGDGLDVIVEGSASRITDEARLRELADAYVAKYGEEWRFTASDGTFHHEAGDAHVFEVRPTKALGFAKGIFGQTRWRF